MGAFEGDADVPEIESVQLLDLLQGALDHGLRRHAAVLFEVPLAALDFVCVENCDDIALAEPLVVPQNLDQCFPRAVDVLLREKLRSRLCVRWGMWTFL